MSDETRKKMSESHTGLVIQTVEERFLDKVDKESSPNGCWLWTGALPHDPRDGYGRLYYKGRTQRDHRVSYQIFHGPIPNGLCVLHNCPGGDNSRCVNPTHLFIGSQGDNIKDAWGKGTFKGSTGHKHSLEVKELLASQRRGIPKPESQRKKFREAKRAASPLNALKVEEIKQLRQEGWTYKALAARFDVCAMTIFNVVKGRTWK